MELIKQYLDSEKKIKELSEEQTKKEIKSSNKVNNTIGKYRDKIWDLERERDKLVNLEKIKGDKIDDEFDKKIKKTFEVIKFTERLIIQLRFKEKEKENIEKSFEKLEMYNEEYFEEIRNYYSDEFMSIRLFIIGNRKPKNKYSLIVLGRVILPIEEKQRPYTYGLPSFKSENLINIKALLLDRPTIEELKEYAFKYEEINKLKLFMQEYKLTKKEYYKTIKQYSLSDFEPLIKYRCKDCDFNMTERESNGYSNYIRENECPKCKSERFWK